jgi:tRNA(Ile)-lysidine synthase
MKWSFLAEKVNQIIIRKMLANPGDRLILGVSGGLDSVVLLHVIMELQPRWEWDITVAHVNHGLRPGFDRNESDFCRDLASKYHLTYVEKDLELLNPEKKREYMANMKQNTSPESLARTARYEAFEHWAQEMKCGVIFTAHHANDQAETILYRMFTGSGLSGLSGIPVKRDIYRRPLKTIMRSELEKYARENSLSYCEDQSNRNEDHIRNKIRHTVIPSLRAMGFENIEQALACSAESIREAEEALTGIIDDLIGKSIFRDAEAVRLRKDDFLRLPAYFQKELLKYVQYDILHNKDRLTDKQLDQICDFISRTGTGRRLEIAGQCMILGREDILWPLKPVVSETYSFPCIDGEYKVSGGVLIINTVERPNQLPSLNRASAFFSNDLRSKTLIWRNWKAGDKMLLFGSGKQKKISDVLKDEKIPPMIKKQQAVLLCEKHIIWVPGVKNSDLYRVGKQDENIMEMQYLMEKNDDKKNIDA